MPSTEAADRMRQALLDGGYEEDDIKTLDRERVLDAPSDLDTQRLMNVARRHGFVKAQKYDRFTITEL